MWNICRTCMCKKEEMISIFNQDKIPSIIDMIMAISSVQFLPNDILPSQMCITCFETLAIAYYFKMQVIRCNNELHKQAQTSNLNPVNEEFQIKEENDDFYDEPCECVTIVNLDVKRSIEHFHCVSNAKEACDNLTEESSSDGIKNDFHFDETCIKYEKVEVEENGVQSEDNGEMTPEQDTTKNKVDVDEYCSGDELPGLEAGTGSDSTFQDVQQSSRETQDTGIYNEKQTSGGEKPYKCTYCNKQFNRKDTLAIHIRKHTNPHTCEICGKLFCTASILKIHMRTHTLERPFQCQQCNATFSRIDNLNRHVRKHTGEAPPKPCKCEICDKAFESPSNLKVHMRSHTDERPFKCQESNCNSSFKHRGDLNRHIRFHTGKASSKPHKCDVCGKTFDVHGNLKIHMRSHSHERPFKCQEKDCIATFKHGSDLKRHMRLHTGTPNPHPCDVCSKTFNTPSLLKMHAITHTKERPFKCQQCNASFTRAYHLNRHMRQHTGENTTNSEVLEDPGLEGDGVEEEYKLNTLSPSHLDNN